MRRRSAGGRMLDLTESNPTRAELPYAEDVLMALADPRGRVYAPDPRGSASARQSVADYYAERGREVSPEAVVLTASTSEAYAFLFQLLADPGDEILAPRPSYPLFEFLAGLACVTMRSYPLRYDGAWHIDFAALEASFSARTRAVVVVNPNNPTGSFLKQDELERLEAIAARRGVAILSDEVFADYAFGEDRQRVTTLVGPRRALTFSLSGLSKVAGLPQLKLGWIVVSGPESGAALEALELIADTYLSVSTPVQVALPALLAAGRRTREAIRGRTRANLEELRAALRASPASVLNVEGGWYAVMQLPRTRSEEAWMLGLLEQDVLVQPGYFFDFEQEAYAVVSLLTPETVFAEGVRRLRAFL